MAKETIIFRRGPLDGKTEEVETTRNYKNHYEIKPDRVIMHHYRRVKKEDPKASEMPEFELEFVEHVDPKTGNRLDS
jgi:hypothetical protein